MPFFIITQGALMPPLRRYYAMRAADMMLDRCRLIFAALLMPRLPLLLAAYIAAQRTLPPLRRLIFCRHADAIVDFRCRRFDSLPPGYAAIRFTPATRRHVAMLDTLRPYTTLLRYYFRHCCCAACAMPLPLWRAPQGAPCHAQDIEVIRHRR